MNVDQLKAKILDVPDFPKPGVMFKDLSTLFADFEAFESLVHHMSESVGALPDKIVAIESRGFIIGAAMAHKMHCGLVLARKKGKLPRETISVDYSLEYGEATLEIHKDALKKGESIIIVDDLLATGGTAKAAETLCQKLEAKVLSHNFIVELTSLNGKKSLGAPIHSLLKY